MVDSNQREPDLSAVPGAADQVGQNSSATPAASTALKPRPRLASRLWRGIGFVLLAFVLMLALALSGFWWWSGRDDSLAYTLQKVARFLPQGQTLEAKTVTGSLRQGGHIGWLQWQSATMKVEVKEIDIGWSLRPLLSRKLELGKVHIAQLEIASTPNPDKTPTEPLQQLTLPLQLDVPFEVDQIIWQGPPQALVEGLKGRYGYDGSAHKLAVEHLQWADGRYDANLVLQGASPMRLQAEINGQVQAPNPLQAAQAEVVQDGESEKQPQASSAPAQAAGKRGATIAVLANLKAEGTLATEAALLQISAHVSARPEVASEEQNNKYENGRLNPDIRFNKLSKEKQKAHADNARVGANSGVKEHEVLTGQPVNMQAQLSASVAPWKVQPLISATADLRDLDVAAFWPQGPRTMLNGQLSAGPLGNSAAAVSNENALQSEAENAAAVGSSELKDTQWQLAVLLENTMPGPWDKRRLPVGHLQSQVQFDGQRWQVLPSHVEVGKGLVELAGFYDTHTALFEGKVDVKQLNPADLYSSLEAAPLQGSLSAVAKEVESRAHNAAGATAVLAPEAPDESVKNTVLPAIQFEVDLQAAGGAAKASSKLLRIQTLSAKGQWLQPVLNLSHLQLEAMQALVSGKDLTYHLDKQQGSGSLRAQVPGAKLDVAGEMGAETGKGQIALQLASMETFAQWLRKLPGVGDPLAGAQLQGKADAQIDWSGGWGKLVQRLQAKRGQDLPASGLQIKAHLTAQHLRYLAAGSAAEQALGVPALELQLDGSPENASLKLKAQALQQAQSVQLDTVLQAGLASAKGAASLDWQASVERLQAQLQLGKDKPGPWLVQLVNSEDSSGRAGGALRVQQRTTDNTVLSTNLSLSAARLQLTPPALGQRRTNAQPLPPVQITWSDSLAIKGGDGNWALKSAGQLQGLPISWVDALSFGEDEPPLAAMGLSGDLNFNGQWDVDTTGKALKALLKIERAGGDLRLAVEDGEGTTVTRTSGPRSAAPGQVRTSKVSGAGMRARIKDARLTVQAQGEEVTAQLLWDSERAGTATAQMRTRLAQVNGHWTLPEKAPLSGQVDAKMPDIGIWSLFAPPGWRIKGSLQAQANISGDIQTPQWQGLLSADDLTISSILDGVDLQQGVLRASLQSNRVDITELRFKGGKGSSTRVLGFSGNLTNAPEDGGELTGSGFAQWNTASSERPAGLSMNLQAKANKLQVLVRADRQVSVSGDLGANLNNGQFVLRGDLTVDRATIILPEESAPSLDKDVVVRTAASRKAEEEAAKKQKRETEKANARAETRKLPDILVKLDLGRDFALQGFGITTRLRGQLEVQGASVAGGPPRITGEVRTEQGRYRAWGQALDVESGIIRFNGPYNNPSLDILAIRPNIAVRAGVQVLGTATAPRVRLYSDPDLPDAEKLSWVVMGRDPSTGGAESALLQQAALALLSGGGGGGTGKIANSLGLDEVGFKGGGDGNGASGAALTMGKRISSKLYLTYEQSLSGAMGTIFIFYDLSRRLTLRAQTGVTSALDLIYTIRKD